jgi:hypothetical protein
MIKKLLAAGLALASAVLVLACNTKPPKQAEFADNIVDKGSDMVAQPEANTMAPVIEDAATKCCKQCKSALAKDRSGSKPETVPCADFTADLSVDCLEHFRGKKKMASECK